VTKLLIFMTIPMFGCQIIENDRIIGRDLAAVNPVFATLDPNLEVARAPIPGATRTFRADEIARLARLNTITLIPPVIGFCFERATETLTIEKLVPALRLALGMDDAQIQILEFSRAGVPMGTLAFSKSGLSAAGIWRGHVTYDESRTVPIWVKVRITVQRTWVEASEPIASGKLINPSQLVGKTGPRFPFGPAPIASIELAAARKSLRAIRAGEPIFASMLTAPHDIERGDNVHVAVSSGGALLEFDAVAQSSARIGESVMVKNPETNRHFQARVETKGKVVVNK
jgi:flagella basal body P-ring formation protein FlgA